MEEEIEISCEKWKLMSYCDVGHNTLRAYMYAGDDKSKWGRIRLMSDRDKCHLTVRDLTDALPGMCVVSDVRIQDFHGKFPDIERRRDYESMDDEWYVEGRFVLRVHWTSHVDRYIECYWPDLRVLYPFLRACYDPWELD